MRAALLALALPLLSACALEQVDDPLSEVQARAWTEPGPAKLTLMTAVNNRTGESGHSALLVSGSQQVLFDPAGSWHHPNAPERGDVLFGMTPQLVEFYVDYHARPTYHMIVQELVVPPETAERALALVTEHGATPMAFCGRAVSGILVDLGFREVDRTWFPIAIARDFGTIPGVTEEKVYDWEEDAFYPDRAAARAEARARLEAEAAVR